ncbi:hypothetical protein D1871_11960 [Nakamurella silvestris]|nr:hypothetical protein D1871_11960 [Nakamurella silvestris]
MYGVARGTRVHGNALLQRSKMKRPSRRSLLVPLVAAAALVMGGLTPATAAVTAPPSSDNGNGTFSNPVIFADVPDVSVTFDGTAYYMTSTTMHMEPSLPIMRSTDQVNWSIAGYTAPILADNDALALRNGADTYGKGTWASSIRFHNGTYYISVASQSTNKTYVYTTKSIENGPWTTSVLAGYLHDQSLLFDGDDLYLVYGAGTLITRKLTENGDGTVSYSGNAVTLVANANVAMTGGLNAEGAHAYKIGNYYYVFMIQWPSGGLRQEVLWRSTSLTPQSEGGVWESKVVLNQRATVEGQAGGGAAQGGVVQAADGKWYAMLFQDQGPVGRSPQLAEVTWVDGWPQYNLTPTMNKPSGTVASPATDIVISDEFTNGTTKAGYWNSANDTALVAGPADAYNGSNLKLQWQWNHNPDNRYWSTTDRPGYLRLTTGSLATGILNAKNTLTQRTYGPTSSGAVSLDVSQMKDGDVTGLAAFQRKYGYVSVKMSGGAKTIVMQRAASDGTLTSTSTAVPLTANKVYLKVDANYKNFANTASFYYSLDGTAWTKIGDNLAMEYTLPHFMGYRFALFNYATTTTGGYVDADWFHASDQIGQGVATNPCTATAAILDNGGFEGTVSPWIGNGTAALALVTDEKVSGASSVLSTGRTKTDHGPRQDVSNKLTAGATYAVSAKVRYTTGPATKQFFITVQDNAFHSFNMAGVVATKGQWATMTGTYTVPTTGLDLTNTRVFVETNWVAGPTTDNDLMNFWTDDVSMIGAAAAFDGGSIDNGGFESGSLTPWVPSGANQLTLTNTDKAGGACSVAVTGRTKTGDGPRQSVANKLTAGSTYAVSAKVKYTTGPATKTFNVTVQDTAFRAFVMGTATVTKGQWTTLTGNYTVPTTGLDLTTARVFVETNYVATPDPANDLMDFWVDEVTIKPGTPPRTPGTGKPAKTVGNSNPLVDYQYGADPYAMVYDGRVYEYMTGDGTEIDSAGNVVQKYEFDATGNIKDNSYGQIKGLNIISSADMVNWTNHGQVKVAGPQGLAKWASNSWAPAATHKMINGKEQFFLYFANSAGGIGVLQADSPIGPFRDPIGKALITQSTPGVAGVVWLFDPAVMIDDDGTAYLYFGGGVPTGQTDHPNTARVIKLGDDMISTVGTAASIDAPALFEDSGINKIGDTYYYSYCTNFSHSPVIDGNAIGNGNIAYMTSKNPMGPFTYQGQILNNPGSVFGAGGNNHHAMFEFNNQMFITYHAQTVQEALVAGKSLDKSRGYRSTHIDKVTINADGSIAPITPTYQGISQQAALNPYQKVEAETIAWDSGLQDAYDTSSGIRVTTLGADNSQGQKLTNINNGEWTSLSGVDFGRAGATAISATVLGKAGGRIQIRLDSAATTNDDNLVGTITVPASAAGTWEQVTATLTKKVTGTHHVFFLYQGAGTAELFDVDNWQFAPALASSSATTITVSRPAVSTKEAVEVNSTITADVAFTGKAQLFDGTTKVAEKPATGTSSGSAYIANASFSFAAGDAGPGDHHYTVKFVSDDTDTVTGSASAEAVVTVYFWDKLPGSSFYDEVTWLAEQGITRGTDGAFDPVGLVDRQSMAAFLYRLAHPGADKPTCTAPPFPDVPVTNQFCGEISWLATTGITAGYNDGRFLPAAKVDRQAMAAFLYRLQHPGASKPNCTARPFADVAVNDQFCGEITWLKASGITTGYDKDQFRPAEKISRQAMAAFLYRLEHTNQ